ncbi:TetR/AcrR family transcriptional regulator [Streptomyces capparidis]
MPTAREALLDAALSALAARPWSAVRMVDVARAAGVSRQTLYNEFGSKDGLARALTRREVTAFYAGVEQALADARRGGADASGRLAAAADQALRAARDNPLVRSVLAGGADERLAAVPGALRPRPGEVVAELRDRALRDHTPGAAPAGGPGPEELAFACEMTVRLALSYTVAPARSAREERAAVARLARALLTRAW